MSSEKAAEIAARLDRLPPSRTVWTMVILISLGGVFEFYDLFFTGYVAPGMVQSGLFKPESLGFFAALQPLAVAGFGTFVFATFAGLWVGTLVLGYVADRSNAITALHTILWDALLVAVALHVLAIAVYAVAKGHNLLHPMLTGVKRLPERIRAPRQASAMLALLLLVISATAVTLLATYL